MYHYILILVTLFILFVLFLLSFITYRYIYKKKFIHINTKIYLINENSVYSYLTNDMKHRWSNLQLLFNNCIYKFLHPYDFNSKEFQNFSSCNVTKYKYEKNNFIFTPFIIFCKEYMNLTIKTNDIEILDKKKIYKIKERKIIPIEINNLENFIVDFNDDNYKLYNKFIEIFNNCDKNIIKICAYGPSGTGKTYFLNKITKLLNKNRDEYIVQILSNDSIIIDNDGYYTIYYHSSFSIVVFLLRLYDDINIKKMKNIFNMPKCNTLNRKFILICESNKYIKQYNDFDIIYEGKYLDNYNSNKIKQKINNIICDKNLIPNIKINKENITINDIVSQYFI